jgi:hypothetical protein
MTAMGTAKSGYIQRKIVKVCEDIQVRYDKTVRDTTGKIYQFCYGNNGYDATKTIRVDDKPSACNIERLANKLNLSYELKMKNIDNNVKNEPEIIVKEVGENIIVEQKDTDIDELEEERCDDDEEQQGNCDDEEKDDNATHLDVDEEENKKEEVDEEDELDEEDDGEDYDDGAAEDETFDFDCD